MTRTRRRGLTLIEANIVIGVASVIIATLGVVLHTMMQIGQDQHADVEQVRIMARLDLQFREDVQQAVVVEFPAQVTDAVGNNSVRLQMRDGSEVRYQGKPGVVHRIAAREETDFHRDAYRLGKNSHCRFEVIEIHPGMKKVVLQIDRFGRRDDDTLAPRYVHRLVAVQRIPEFAAGGPQE